MYSDDEYQSQDEFDCNFNSYEDGYFHHDDQYNWDHDCSDYDIDDDQQFDQQACPYDEHFSDAEPNFVHLDQGHDFEPHYAPEPDYEPYWDHGDLCDAPYEAYFEDHHQDHHQAHYEAHFEAHYRHDDMPIESACEPHFEPRDSCTFKPRTSGTNSRGNTYNTPGGSNSNQSSSYHYSNTDGSYYYRNDNGSTYHASASGGSTYTAPSGNSTYTAPSASSGGRK